MKPETKSYSATVGSRTVTFETGKLAAQAGVVQQLARMLRPAVRRQVARRRSGREAAAR